MESERTRSSEQAPKRARGASALVGIVCAIAPALGVQAAAADCKLVRVAEWPVQLERNRLTVQGAVNGQAVRVLLDTGSDTSLMQRAAATRLGLTRRSLPGYRIYGVGGESHAETAFVEEFSIGPAVRRNWEVMVAGEQGLHDSVAVLLGDDFLHNFEVEFDLPQKAVRLYQTRDCGGVPLAYWTRERAGEAAIETGSRVHVTVQIDGRPIRALLDSGATTSILTQADAERLGVTPESPGVVPGGCRVGIGGTRVDSWVGKFQSFTIGNVTVRNPTLHFADLWRYTTQTNTGSRLAHNPAGLPQFFLGVDFLRTHRVLIAYSQQKVYFTYVGGTVFPAPPGRPCSEAVPRPN